MYSWCTNKSGIHGRNNAILTYCVAAIAKVLDTFPFVNNSAFPFTCIALTNNLNAGPLSSAIDKIIL